MSISIPPRGRKLTVSITERLIKSLIYDSHPLDKVVILLDLDGKDPDQELHRFRSQLPKRIRNQSGISIQYAYAQWHLEAWYFGDARSLRELLSRQALGHVDTTQPDKIENPKLHLKNLLGDRRYTALVAAEIAGGLDAPTIAQRSPSFRGFLEAIKNGSSTEDPQQ